MNKKLSRIDIIEYCNKCKHVKKSGLTTVCGLTNVAEKFDYNCDKFIPKGSKEIKKDGFWKSWTFPLLMSFFGFHLILFSCNYDLN